MITRRKKPKFLRKDWHKKSRLGKGRKSKQKWLRPRGRHSKLREKKKGHAKSPSIGFSQAREIRGKIAGLKPIMVYNVDDLKKVGKDEIAIFAAIGKKKKIEMAEKAKEWSVKTDFNLEEFLKSAKEKFENRKKERKGREKQAEEKIKAAEKAKEKSAREQAKEEGAGKGKEEEKKVEVAPAPATVTKAELPLEKPSQPKQKLMRRKKYKRPKINTWS